MPLKEALKLSNVTGIRPQQILTTIHTDTKQNCIDEQIELVQDLQHGSASQTNGRYQCGITSTAGGRNDIDRPNKNTRQTNGRNCRPLCMSTTTKALAVASRLGNLKRVISYVQEYWRAHGME